MGGRRCTVSVWWREYRGRRGRGKKLRREGLMEDEIRNMHLWLPGPEGLEGLEWIPQSASSWVHLWNVLSDSPVALRMWSQGGSGPGKQRWMWRPFACGLSAWLGRMLSSGSLGRSKGARWGGVIQTSRRAQIRNQSRNWSSAQEYRPGAEGPRGMLQSGA